MPRFRSSNRHALSFFWIRLGLCLALAVSARPAFADDDRDFQEHYQRGIQLYKLNFLRQAIKEFVAAYAANPLPRLLYNLGQLQRKIGDYKDATESYELYLRTDSDITPERRKEVERYLEALRSATPGSAAATLPPSSDTTPSNIKTKVEVTSPSADPPPLLLILPPSAANKAGRYMFNMGLGYTLPFFQSGSNSLFGLVLRPEFGIGVTQSRAGYLILSPQIQIVSDNYTFFLTAGFQYDFPILARGLFLYVRGSAGYELSVLVSRNPSTGMNNVALVHYGLIMPEVGFKYSVNGKVNFGFEPVSLPVAFNGNGVQGAYRLLFYSGVNF